MAPVVHLATHVVLWLCAGDTALLSASARRATDDRDCAPLVTRDRAIRANYARAIW